MVFIIRPIVYALIRHSARKLVSGDKSANEKRTNIDAGQPNNWLESDILSAVSILPDILRIEKN